MNKRNAKRSGRGNNSKTKMRNMDAKNARRDVEIRDTSERELKADDRMRRDCFRSTANDPAWYAQNPQLIRDYASFPFGQALGSKINYGGYLASDTNLVAIPGIASYYFAPTVGNPTDANAPINVAMRNIYSFVRHANSGHSNYDAPDLMLYLLAMDSVYMYHAFLKRIAGLVLDYTTMNRYYPSALVQAMGVDFDDVSSHIQDFRGFINQYAVKMGSMCVPNSMSYMARHTWMCEGLYTDSATSKAQTYFYTPSAFLQFSRDSNQVGKLDYVQFVHPAIQSPINELKSYSDLVTFGNSLLNVILQEEDFNIMSGDILKAFGNEGVVKVSGIAEGYMVLPQYNQEVLSQMENATIFNGYFNNSIVQNTSIDGGYLEITDSNFTQVIDPTVTIKTNPSLAYANAMIGPYTLRHLLNFHKEGVTPEEVMVATRLTNIVDPYTTAPTLVSITTGTQIQVSVPTLASEIITCARVWYYSWYNQGTMTLTSTTMPKALYNPIIDGSALQAIYGANNLANRIGSISNFDWHPLIVPVNFTYTDSGSISYMQVANRPISDKDYFTFIDKDNLINMTTAALLSEFSVPQMGAFATKI